MRDHDAGHALPASVRTMLERGLSADLGAVRVHHGPAADRLARGLSADAFTCGAHVYFRRGAYRPDTRDGLRLLAHELAHVVQQAGEPRGQEPIVVARRDDPREEEADRWADRVLAGRPAARHRWTRVPPGRSRLVQRHLSFEHRFLGDIATSDVRAVWGSPAERTRVLSGQLRLLELWQRRPDTVTRAQVLEKCPWLNLVEVGPGRLLVTYGELNALPDYVSDASAIDTVDSGILIQILQSIRQEGYNRLSKILTGTNPRHDFDQAVSRSLPTDLAESLVESALLDELTSGLGAKGTAHYSGILARNACHFAPYTWYRWQTSHLIARDYARRYAQTKDDEVRRQAWVYHGYADHFLQDSFAAGHLINKTLIMQWFLEWADKSDHDGYRSVDWDVVREMTRAKQPGLVDRGLYDNPWFAGKYSNDPQTVQEEATPLRRISGSGVAASGATSKAEAYQKYLTFLTGTITQLASATVHDHFNASSLWVAAKASTQPYQIWGDDTLLSAASGANGAAATSEAATLSRQALNEILATGQTSITTEQIFNRFPTRAGSAANALTSLEDWAFGQKSLCQDTLFPGISHAKVVAVRTATPRLGIVSRDQVFANVWYRRVGTGSSFTVAHSLVHEGVLYVGANGWLYALNAESGKVLRSVRLHEGDGETRVATDGTYVFAGVEGNVYGVSPAGGAVWTTNLDALLPHPVTLLYDRGHLFAGSNGWIYRLSPQNGGILNRRRLSRVGVETRLATDGTRLFAGLYGSVYAVTIGGDWSKDAWPEISLRGYEHVSVLCAGGTLFAGTNGRAYRVDPGSGRTTGDVALASTIGVGNYETRLASDGVRLFAGTHGSVYGLPVRGSWTKASWSCSLVGYGEVDVLVNAGRLYAGSNGYAYEIEPGVATPAHTLLLTYGVGLGDFRTQLSTDGTYLYGGAHGYAYKVVDNDTWLGGGTMFRDQLTLAGWQGAWIRPDQAPASVRSVEMMLGQQNNLETFACTSDGTVYHSWKQAGGQWQGWEPHFRNAPPMQRISGFIAPGGTLEVLGIGVDGACYHIRLLNNGWQSQWQRLAGAPHDLRSLYPVKDISSSVDVLAVGAEGVVYHATRTSAGWSPTWTPNFRGAPAMRSVTANFSTPDRLEVFGIGVDGTLHHTAKYGDAWQGAWTPRFLGSPPLRDVAAKLGANHRLQLLAVGTDDVLRVAERTSTGWSPWTANPWTAPPLKAVATRQGPQGNLEVFGIGTDGVLHHTAQFANGWQLYWTADFDNAPAPIEAVALGVDDQRNLEVFAIQQGNTA